MLQLFNKKNNGVQFPDSVQYRHVSLKLQLLVLSKADLHIKRMKYLLITFAKHHSVVAPTVGLVMKPGVFYMFAKLPTFLVETELMTSF